MAYAGLGPRLFLKRGNGSLPPLSYFLCAPYHLLNTVALFVFRRGTREHAFDRIASNVYLGCRLHHSDAPTLARLGVCSVLDVCAEFGETEPLRRLRYLSLPVLDTDASSLKTLQIGADWLQQETAIGSVYVHCALGHGRSALFVAAFLLQSGRVRTPDEAVAFIKEQRPGIKLHPKQRTALQQFAEIHLLPMHAAGTVSNDSLDDFRP